MSHPDSLPPPPDRPPGSPPPGHLADDTQVFAASRPEDTVPYWDRLGWTPPPEPPPWPPGVPPGPPRRRWRKVLLLTVVGLVVAFVAAGIAGGLTQHKVAPRAEVSVSAHASAPQAALSAPASSSASADAANPQATAQGSCSYTLGTDANNTDWLTAEVDLDNTGNVGVYVKVTVSWPQEGYSPVTATRTVKLPYGASGQPVSFHVFAGSNNSPSNVIDNLQAWEQGHNYPSNDCSYSATITREYGPVH